MKFEIIRRTIDREGGFSDHKSDRGGKTRYGVTEKIAREYGYEGKMENLPLETAVDIFNTRFWHRLFNKIEDEHYQELIFDAEVNHGSNMGVRLAQRSYNTLNKNTIKEDGLIGPETLKAINNYRYPRRLKLAMIFVRAEFFRKIVLDDKTQKDFIGGWFNRLAKLYKIVIRR